MPIRRSPPPSYNHRQAAAASQFNVNAIPNNLTAGSATSVTFTAVDAFGNAVTGYTGPVTFTARRPGGIRHAVQLY